jgi:predicted CXXCH cytochrome family protein
MSRETGRFTVSFADLRLDSLTFEQDVIYIGRLDTCEIVLDNLAVSRVHAGITYRDSKYYLANLSSSNVLTLNGRMLETKQTDVLADGDTIQIGPFTIRVARLREEILLVVEKQFADDDPEKTFGSRPFVRTAAEPASQEAAGVLDVFWEKRTRDDKDDFATRLRPTEKPKPGKAMFNWKPTRDLRKPWRYGLFIWAFLIVGAIGAFAYFRYPVVYEPKPLSSPHASKIESSTIAVTANGNSCTTCHTLNEPIENSCIRCHSAAEFRASNTKAHEEAGITCTMCHREHQGTDFDMKATAIQACSQCHNDNNSRAYNGKTVRTAHGGSYGYPVVDGVWKWKGVYREVADAMPEINSSATGDKDEQAKLSREFHTIHVGRLKAPEGVQSDKRGLVSCSSCHKSFDPLDRRTPRETCAACHTTAADSANRDKRFGSTPANCISCHVQHPYSAGRWNEFLSEDALQRRKDAIGDQIRKLNTQ